MASSKASSERALSDRKACLVVACFLDHQGWSVEKLLREPPSEAAVEAILRGEQAGSSRR